MTKWIELADRTTPGKIRTVHVAIDNITHFHVDGDKGSSVYVVGRVDPIPVQDGPADIIAKIDPPAPAPARPAPSFGKGPM